MVTLATFIKNELHLYDASDVSKCLCNDQELKNIDDFLYTHTHTHTHTHTDISWENKSDILDTMCIILHQSYMFMKYLTTCHIIIFAKLS